MSCCRVAALDVDDIGAERRAGLKVIARNEAPCRCPKNAALRVSNVFHQSIS
jgi:hypothetical protein